MNIENKNITYSKEVLNAKILGEPIVALESTVLTHGLPFPQNTELASEMEDAVRQNGATPATIALLDGKIQVGMEKEQIKTLIEAEKPIKVSLRDFATAITLKRAGGTTVAGTMFAANKCGIKVFATGGIGGVHKEAEMDISTDLIALSNIPVMVVCAGAKSILNLPATLEYLETMGVPVIGYQTDSFPEFYSRGSKLRVSVRLDDVKEIAAFALNHWSLGLQSGILVCQPVEEEFEIKEHEISDILKTVSNEVIALQKENKLSGQQVTPYELMRVNELTDGRSLKTNMRFLLNNGRLAGKLAREMGSDNNTNFS